MGLNEVIKHARLKKGLKQEEAARKAEVTVQTYSKWENGKTEPKASQVTKLAEILGISEREICSGQLFKRYELEEFGDLISACSGNSIGMKMTMLLWRYTHDHEGFLQTVKDAYGDEQKTQQDIIRKIMQKNGLNPDEEFKKLGIEQEN